MWREGDGTTGGRGKREGGRGMGPPEGGVRGGREGDGTTGGRGKREGGRGMGPPEGGVRGREGGGWDHRREG